MYKILRIPFVVLLALLPGPFVSGQVRFTTVASGQELGKDDYLQVQFVVENASAVDQFTPPDFAGFQVMQEPMQSSETTVTNGKMSQKESLTYTLKPLKTGKFTIGGASALIDGKKMQSNSIHITVTARSSGNPGNNPNSNPISIFPQLSMPDAADAGPERFKYDYLLKPGENVKEKIRKDLFVKVDVSKTNCYVGEPIVVAYKVYSRCRFETRETKHPTLNGFSVYDMSDPRGDPGTIEKVGGKPFIVHILRKAQLIPLQARTVELDPIELENTVHFIKPDGRQPSAGSGDALRDLLSQLSEEPQGQEVEEQVTLDTKPVPITIKPLPEKDKPLDFTGAVGNFSIVSELVNRNISAEDEADLKITISGSGNLPVISAPLLQWPAGVESFDPKAKEEVNKNTIPLSGTKTFDYVFTTRAPGHYTLPPVTLSYFDPSAGIYKTIRSNPLDFQVIPAAKKKNLPEGLITAASVQGGGLKALIDRHLELLFAVLILSCLAFYLWRENRRLNRSGKSKKTADRGTENGTEGRDDPRDPDQGRRLWGRPEKKGPEKKGSEGAGAAAAMTKPGVAGMQTDLAGRIKRAERKERAMILIDPLSDVRERLENGDYQGFYRELNRIVWRSVSDKLDLPASELNKYNVVRKLEAQGWDATTTLSLEHLLSECEMNLYTPDYDTYNMQQLLGQAESLLGILISDTSY